jgi:hypothetical protein
LYSINFDLGSRGQNLVYSKFTSEKASGSNKALFGFYKNNVYGGLVKKNCAILRIAPNNKVFENTITPVNLHFLVTTFSEGQ